MKKCRVCSSPVTLNSYCSRDCQRAALLADSIYFIQKEIRELRHEITLIREEVQKERV